MEEKLKQLEEKLKQEKQEQILQYPIKYTEELINQLLSVNYDQLKKLYKKAIEGEEKNKKEIEPISAIEKEKLSEEEKNKYEKIGETLIKEGKYAVVTMAGGQRNKARTQWTKSNV